MPVIKTDPILIFTLITSVLFGFQSALAQGGGMNFMLKQNLEDLVAIQKRVDAYIPNGRTWLAGEYDDPWLLRAISMRAREKWAKQEVLKPDDRKLFDPVFNALAASIAKKMPLHKPKPENFAFHNKNEEEVMKSRLENIETLKIHKIGFSDKEWQPAGITSPPFKKGFVWASDTSDDHPYCHLYSFTLSQKYMGNNQYDDSELTSTLQDDVLVGCP
jgi:hypothetical protein